MRRILLLTGTAPAPNGVGGIILNDQSKFLPPDSLRVVHLVDGPASYCDTTIESGAAMRVLPVRFQRRPESRWGRAGRALAWLGMTLGNRRQIREGTSACIEYAKAQNVGEVWAVLDAPATIELAKPVAEGLGVPLRTMVWDDIEHNVRYFGLDRFTAAHNRGAFAAAIRHSISLAVIGETMRDSYRQRYGRDGVVVRHGAEQYMPGAAERTDARPSPGIRIGFAGSVSARSAFECLLDALDSLGWEISGRPVTLVLMGGRFVISSRVARNVECLGWRSVEQTISILSGCTLNYLPQPFEEDWRAFSELSFPSKLTTYLAAGVPLLLHAPDYASLPSYFRRRAFGALCTSLDSSLVASALQRLVIDADLRKQAQDAANLALAEDFSTACFRNSFSEFLAMQLDKPES